MYRLEVETLGATPETAVAPLFGWAAGDLELVDRAETGASSHLLYRQVHLGIPVWNRSVRISLDSEERVTMVVSGFEPGLELSNLQPGTAPENARSRAAALVAEEVGARDPGSIRTSEAELVIVPDTRGFEATLAWRVMVWPSYPIAEFEVLLDASTSGLLHLEDQTVRRTGESRWSEAPTFGSSTSGSDQRLPGWQAASQPGNPRGVLSGLLDYPRRIQGAAIDATGTVFDPDPLATSGSDYAPPFIDNGDATTPEIDAEMKTVTLRDVTRGADGLVRLEGPYLRIVGYNRGGADVYTPPAESQGLFTYDRSQPGFEATNVYYHIDTNQRYIQSLGILDLQSQSPIPVNPQGTTSDDSGWFADQRFLFFGTGGVDDGEDGAVILHEYAHALLEGGAPGLRGTVEGRALHEGWADYWAMSYQRGLMDSGSLARDDWEQVFRWDSGMGVVWSGRTLDFVGRYPNDICSSSGSPACAYHNDGRLWGTVLMEVYSDLGREVTDRLNLLSHRYLTSPVTFSDAAQAVVQADIDHYGGAHVEALVNRFDARGLVDAGQFGPIVSHDALPASEDVGGSAEIQVSAQAIGGPLDRVEVQWRHGQGSFSVLSLTEQSPGEWGGAFPLPGSPQSVSYFITAVDAQGRETVEPAGAPETVFSFEVGPDLEAPSVVHMPVADVSLAQWPPLMAAQISDNLGVASATVEYALSVPGSADAEGTFSLVEGERAWTAPFPVNPSVIAVGSSVIYTITVEDRAQSTNRTRVGPYSFEVSGSGVLRSFDAESMASPVQVTGSFQAGAPDFGTTVAPTGETVWGTLPGSAYPPSAGVSTLELPPSNLQESGEPLLAFWHWYDTEHDGRADPSGGSGEVLWDGGNVKMSLDGGVTWELITPRSGYTGTIIGGPDNPLSGQQAFGGFSFGWRRAVFELPATSNVRIRFEFGTDATNSEQSEFFAGWLLDDIVITNALPDGAASAFLIAEPDLVSTAPAGSPLPPISVRVGDDVGVSDAWIDYEYVDASGTTIGSVRMAQAPGSLADFSAVITAPGLPAPGDRVDWQLRLRDVDGNEAVFPDGGPAGYTINIRLAQNVSLLPRASGGDGWRQEGSAWVGTGEALGGLVMPPVTVAVNGEAASFKFRHQFRFGAGVGGQVEVSRDGGSTWALAEPVGGYGGVLESEGAFRGESTTREDHLDLSLLAGEVVQVRLRAKGTGASAEWSVFEASFAQESGDPEFQLPAETVLHPNFPDPFRGSTTVSYSLPESATVDLTLHDMLGRRVAVVDAGVRDAGTHTVVVRADNLASGVYLLRLDSGSAVKFEMVTVAR